MTVPKFVVAALLGALLFMNQPVLAQDNPGNQDDIKRFEADLAKLRAQIADLEGKLKKAREDTARAPKEAERRGGRGEPRKEGSTEQPEPGRGGGRARGFGPGGGFGGAGGFGGGRGGPIADFDKRLDKIEKDLDEIKRMLKERKD